MLFDHELAWTDERIYRTIYENSLKEPAGFWESHISDMFCNTPPSGIYNVNASTWLDGCVSNVCYNCVDRHAILTPDKTAIIWHGDEAGERTETSYAELMQQVVKIASVIRSFKIKAGDVVCIHMSMEPAAIAAMMACARIGVLHLVVFTGFSPEALAYRIKSSNARAILTMQAAARRGGKETDIMGNVRAAIAILDESIPVIPLDKIDEFGVEINDAIEWQGDRSNLFVLYTSGSSGNPKGIIHSALPYILYVSTTFKVIFGASSKDVYFCTSDIGWITGHSYVAYAPLFHGLTIVMFCGSPTYPTADRYWSIIEQERASIFYSSPTAIRTLQMFESGLVRRRDLSSLKVLGTVGEPIDETAWKWYFEVVGQKRCPIIDSWWQTETGGIAIAPLRNLNQKPGISGKPFFGIKPEILSAGGDIIGDYNVSGQLALRSTWPGMCRSVMYECKYVEQQNVAFCENVFAKMYFNEGMLLTGDTASYDEDHDIRVTGRMDDVLNISGHRLGTAEFEEAINRLDEVVENAVVAVEHPVKGQAVFVFIVLREQSLDSCAIVGKIVDIVKKSIGPIAKPDFVTFVSGLPKTRSGKIVRSLLRSLACGCPFDNIDISSVINPDVILKLKVAVKNALDCPDLCLLSK
ncbi:MAG: AMP-binding protein [Holosporales bacterium]|jgi:acetyl-CoA synthetase|nr:AMP-binding protein [Holosporales bacterium]